jgi:hypothetical protein
MQQRGRARLYGNGADLFDVPELQARPLDNISYRLEYFDDKEGQRTGVKTAYVETGIGWQHWFSPQIEIRPEFRSTSR